MLQAYNNNDNEPPEHAAGGRCHACMHAMVGGGGGDGHCHCHFKKKIHV